MIVGDSTGALSYYENIGSATTPAFRKIDGSPVDGLSISSADATTGASSNATNDGDYGGADYDYGGPYYYYGDVGSTDDVAPGSVEASSSVDNAVAPTLSEAALVGWAH